jgi:AraC family L-rhamnose operon regulatory protein RhaS
MTVKAAHTPAKVVMPAWGVCVFESHHAADFRMELSRHNEMEVFFVLAGAGVFELEGQGLRCGPGDVVVVPPAHGHRITDEPGQPLSLLGVRIGPAVWAQDPELGWLVPSGRLARDPVVGPRVRAGVRRLLFEQTSRQPGRAGMMVGLALQLLAVLARARGASPDPAEPRPRSDLRGTVEAYVAELAHRFFEPARIDGVAAQLGMSRRRFTELFREVTGATWCEYLRQLRVEHAKHLLRATGRSVLAIAFEAGFEDLSSFYRAFRRQEKTSPHRWRQRPAEA